MAPNHRGHPRPRAGPRRAPARRRHPGRPAHEAPRWQPALRLHHRPQSASAGPRRCASTSATAAYVVGRYSGQYGSEDGDAATACPCAATTAGAFSAPVEISEHLEFGDGIALPTGSPTPRSVRARDLGVFDEPALTKRPSSNFITPGFARYGEYFSHIAPEGNKHLYSPAAPTRWSTRPSAC
ncbi:MAG: hypothetical protein R3F43_14355 [bacterium]